MYVSADLLAAGRRSLGIRAAQSGNHRSEGTTWEYFLSNAHDIRNALVCQKVPSLRSSYEIKMSVKHGGMTLTEQTEVPGEPLPVAYFQHQILME
jgi:hypothetical protein